MVGVGERWRLFPEALNTHEDRGHPGRGRGFALGVPHARVWPWVPGGTGAPEHCPALVQLPWGSRALPGDEHPFWGLAGHCGEPL